MFARKEESFSLYNYSSSCIAIAIIIYIGCGTLWVTDGIWKLVFPHCMHRLKVNAQQLYKSCMHACKAAHLFIIIHSMLWSEFHQYLCQMCMCTYPPMPGKAFCQDHCKYLESQVPPVPTDLRSFLKHCKIQNGKKIIIRYTSFIIIV